MKKSHRLAQIYWNFGTNIRLILLLFLFSFSFTTKAQGIISGNYEVGLSLAYDSNSGKISGYFEDCTGWDANTQSPLFCCSFYFSGNLEGNQCTIYSFYPSDSAADLITGTFELIGNKSCKIKLQQDHGGCSNVRHFSDSALVFNLVNAENWTQIRFVTLQKTYFYSSPSLKNRMKTYLLKNDWVCIHKVIKDWAYCSYYGEKTTKAWIKLSDLNKN